jgi:hypothetical protein
MAIDSYANLKTALANWLDRSDLTSRLDEFIELAEARFADDIRIRAMETTVTQALTAGTRSYSLPTGYLQGRNFQINTDPITALEYVTPEMMDRIWAGSKTGRPKTYTILGDNYLLGPSPDTADTLEITYYKEFTPLSSGATTNWLILNRPNLYLYACLLEAAPFLGNPEEAGVWARYYQEALERLHEADARDRFSGSALTIKTTAGNP